MKIKLDLPQYFHVRGYNSITILYTFTKMVSCDWPWDFLAFIRSSSSELEIEDDSSVDDLVWFSNKLLIGRFVEDWKRDSFGRQDCFIFRCRVCSSVASSWFDDSVLLDCPANKRFIEQIWTHFVIHNIRLWLNSLSLFICTLKICDLFIL